MSNLSLQATRHLVSLQHCHSCASVINHLVSVVTTANEWRYALQLLSMEILSILEDEGVEKEAAK